MSPSEHSGPTTGNFIIDTGEVQHDCADRAEAVLLAKRLSRSARGTVMVQRNDGRLKMEFQNGKMTRFRSLR
tara:strand:- start:383 stop:598 length:216 start_codon:yes stop_codon:yes gene_type:complete